MKTITTVGPIVFLCALMLLPLAGRSQAVALRSSDLTGASASDALDMTCDWMYLPASYSIWYRIPRPDAELVGVELVADPAHIEDLALEIYSARPEELEQGIAAGPIGQAQVRDFLFVKAWTGKADRDMVYYANLTNRSHYVASYGVCGRVQSEN